MDKTMTVSYLPDMSESTWKPHGIPYIRMRGQWLLNAGFDIGSRITVNVEQGKLTITKQAEE